MRIALLFFTFAIGLALGVLSQRWVARFAFRNINAEVAKAHDRSSGQTRHEQLLYGAQAGVLTQQEHKELERLNARFRHPSTSPTAKQELIDRVALQRQAYRANREYRRTTLRDLP